jgi:hypothetical protein
MEQPSLVLKHQITSLLLQVYLSQNPKDYENLLDYLDRQGALETLRHQKVASDKELQFLFTCLKEWSISREKQSATR